MPLMPHLTTSRLFNELWIKHRSGDLRMFAYIIGCLYKSPDVLNRSPVVLHYLMMIIINSRLLEVQK